MSHITYVPKYYLIFYRWVKYQRSHTSSFPFVIQIPYQFSVPKVRRAMHALSTGPGAIQTVCPRLAWICGPPQNTGKQCPLTAMLRTPWFTCVLYPAWTVWCNASRLLVVLKLWTKCKRYYRCESRFTTHSRPVFNHVYINHCCISYLTYILLVICKYST